MDVEVTLTNDKLPAKFVRTKGYHVDPQGYLHIRGMQGNLATYAPGQWCSAALVGDAYQQELVG